MSLVAAAVTAARQQKPRLLPVAKSAAAWFSADSLSACSQFWYDEAEYHPYYGEVYLWLPGISGVNIAMPDRPELQVSGDIDIRVHLALDDWTRNTERALLAKEGNSTNRSYRLFIRNDNTLGLMLSGDGSSAAAPPSTIALSFANYSAHWVRATYRTLDRRVQYFTSENGTDWSQLGVDVTHNATSIYKGNASLEIGSRWGSLNPARGMFFAAQIYDGIDGTLVADFKAQNYQENGWVINGQQTNGDYPVVVENSHTPRYRAMFGSTAVADTGEPKILTIHEPAAAIFHGRDGQAFSIPKSSFLLDVSEDFDVQFTIAATNWATSGLEGGVCNLYETSGRQRSWGIRFTNNVIRVYFSNDGLNNTAVISPVFTSVVNPINNEYLEFKIQFRYVGQKLLIAFKVRPPGAASWLDLGFQEAEYTTLFAANTKFQVGGRYASGGVSKEVFNGKISKLQVTQNGTVLAYFNAAHPNGWTMEEPVGLSKAHQLPYAYLPGTSNNYLTNNVHANLSNGPIFLWGWYSGVPGSTVISQHHSAVGRRSIAMNGVNNAIRIFWSADGTNQTIMDSPIAPNWWAATSICGGYIGVLIDPAAQSITYYDGGQDPTNYANWTELSAINDVTGLELYDNTDVPTFIGANSFGSYQIATGKIYRAGIGTSTNDLFSYVRFDSTTFNNWSVVTTVDGYQAAIITRNTIMFDGIDDYISYPARDGIQPLNTSATYGVIGTIGVQPSGTYNRFFSMEEGNGGYRALFSMYAEPPLGVYTQLDDGTGGVSTSVAQSNIQRPYVVASKIDRQSGVQRTYVNGQESATGNIAAYSSISVTGNAMHFGRTSFAAGSYMRGYQLYGFFVMRRLMTTAELNEVGQATLPEAYA